MKRSRGQRVGTRHRLRKDVRSRGMPTITQILQDFKVGERVYVKVEPSIPKGMPHPRFQGTVGEVTGKRGSGFIVSIKDGNKAKTIISRAVHLRRVTK